MGRTKTQVKNFNDTMIMLRLFFSAISYLLYRIKDLFNIKGSETLIFNKSILESVEVHNRIVKLAFSMY